MAQINGIPAAERGGVETLVKKLMSDSDFQSNFKSDPRSAISSSGVSLSSGTVDQIVATAAQASSLISQVDHVEGAVFFFFIAVAGA